MKNKNIKTTDEMKKIMDKFDKILENYELDKAFGQLSIDSICHLFPNEIIVIKDYMSNLQKTLDKTVDAYTEEYNLRKKLSLELSTKEDALIYIDEEIKKIQSHQYATGVKRLNKIKNILNGVIDENK